MGNKTIYDNVVYNFPNTWPSEDFEDVLVGDIPDYKKYKRREILPNGKIPVIDQGIEPVAGYINDDKGKYSGDLPLIIFGDHTRIVKYIDFDFAVGADGTKLLKPKETLLEKFFYYYLRSVYIPSSGYSRHYKYLKEIRVPTPDKTIQKAIISKLDKLLPRVQIQINRLTKAKLYINRFKQTLLSDAFTGKLTEDWRLNNVHVEPASELVDRIHNEENINFKLKKRKKVSFITSKHEVPTWLNVKLDNLVYIAARIGWRGLKAEEYTNEGPLLLSVPNLNYGEYINFEKVYHITRQRYDESPEIQLQENDILLVKDGAGIGKLGIVKNLPQEATVNSSLLVIRGGEAFIPEYLYYFLSGPALQSIVKLRITGSATPHLFQRDIKEFMLALPPIEEQKEIVNIIRTYLATIDKVEDQIEKAETKIGKLTQSILAKAFKN